MTSSKHALSAVAAVLLLTACGSDARPGATTVTTLAPAQDATATTPTISLPAPSTPASAAPAPASTASPSAARRQVVDVTAKLPTAGHVGFASPSGRIKCWMSTTYAGCWFPSGMDMAGIPAHDCDDAYPNGIDVRPKELHWSCVLGVEYVDAATAPWFRSTGWPAGPVSPTSDMKGDAPVAALPYGSSVRVGQFQCDSDETGMSCSDLRSGVGFTVARAGLRLRGVSSTSQVGGW